MAKFDQTSLNNLQGLRAYAAVSVMMVHLVPLYGFSSPIGNYGVDLFFVLSGFLMSMITASDPSFFLRRRIIRIVPAYWACTIGVFLVASFKPDLLHSTRPEWSNLLKSLCFIPYRKENGLLQPMLNPGWTLNYEMYFYLLFAAVLWLKFRRPSIWVAALVVLLPFASLWWHPPSDLIQFYSSQMVLDFVLGIGVYYVLQGLPELPSLRRWELPGVFFLMFLLPLSESCIKPSNRVFWLGLPAAFLILLAIRVEQSGWRLKNPLILLLGDASYVLYLTQLYVFQVGEKVIRIHRFALPIRILLGFGLVLTAVTLACSLHLLLEVPILRMLKRLLTARKSAPRPVCAVKILPEAPSE